MAMACRSLVSENRKLLVCVDSYAGGVPEGRFYTYHRQMERFGGLTRLLLGVDELLDEQRQPQAYTEPRRFAAIPFSGNGGEACGSVRQGRLATFELQVVFRQHSSWQGVLRWREKNMEQSFRSVLELIFLLDSALRDSEGGECA